MEGSWWAAGMRRVVEGRSLALLTHTDCCSSPFLTCFLCGPGDKHSESTDLMKVPMVIMDRRECTKVFPKLTKNMLCAGYANKSYDSCQVTRVSPPCLSRSSSPQGCGQGCPLSTGNKQRVWEMCGIQGVALGMGTWIGKYSL